MCRNQQWLSIQNYCQQYIHRLGFFDDVINARIPHWRFPQQTTKNSTKRCWWCGVTKKSCDIATKLARRMKLKEYINVLTSVLFGNKMLKWLTSSWVHRAGRITMILGPTRKKILICNYSAFLSLCCLSATHSLSNWNTFSCIIASIIGYIYL